MSDTDGDTIVACAFCEDEHPEDESFGSVSDEITTDSGAIAFRQTIWFCTPECAQEFVQKSRADVGSMA